MVTDPERFHGFPKACPDFLAELARNNNKSWFDAHRKLYEESVMAPARNFVWAMGRGLTELSPRIHADPTVNKSIFRINRDTRFSTDKSPYKTHLGLWFWEGHRPRMECAGFYFHIEPHRMMLGAGLYRFTRELLEQYRLSVVHPKHGPALARALAQVSANDGYGVGGEHFKKIPRGFDPEHKNARLLLHDGLYVGVEGDIPTEFYSEDLVGYCLDRYRRMLPLHKWLLALTERAA